MGALTRRQALQVAAGLGLSFLLPAMDLRAATRRGPERRKSLITLWLAGGPSQLETWDPHPGTSIGGPTQAIATKNPELAIASTYPRLAEQIHELSVIRSLVSKEGDHERGTYFLKTGYRPDPTLVHPSVGAILAHEQGDTSVEIPMHISLGGGQWPARGGFLGDEYDAFKIFDPGQNLHNMRAKVNEERQERRLENLKVMSAAFRRGRRVQVESTLHQQTVERALSMMTSDQLSAFMMDEEPTELKTAYGDSRFGRGCLIARRLVEVGVRSVEVTLDGFDTHANNFENHQANAQVLDPAFATLINDLKQRDLLDSTIVLCIGEFGRTPRVNPLDGRDHWPSGFSCVLGGGGIRGGLVIGSTDPEGNKKEPSQPIEVHDLYATVFKTFGVDFEHEYMTPIGRPMAVCAGKPIPQLG